MNHPPRKKAPQLDLRTWIQRIGEPNTAIELDPKIQFEEIRLTLEEGEAIQGLRLTEERLEQIVKLLSLRAATGHRESFVLLVNLATNAARCVGDLVDTHFLEARKIARRCHFWPIPLARSKYHYEAAQGLLERLELAGDYQVRIDVERTLKKKFVPKRTAIHLIFITSHLRSFVVGMAFPTGDSGISEEKRKFTPPELENLELLFESEDAVVRRLKWIDDWGILGKPAGVHISSALAWLDSLAEFIAIPDEKRVEKIRSFWENSTRLITEACFLPDLGKRTIKPWADFGEKVIMFLTDNHPERNDLLKNVGLYRGDVYYRKLEKQGKTRSEIEKIKASGSAKKSEGSNIQDGIFTKIRQAYGQVLKGSETGERRQPKASP